MKIIPLSEGAYTVGRDKKFAPFDVEKDNLQDRPRGSLLVEIQPFVVITSSDVLLLDSGLGKTDEHGNLFLYSLLEEWGVHADEVTKVLVSHLHKDHSGGLLLPDKKTPAFPNATYYINKKEWDLASTPAASYVPEDFLALENVVFLEGSGVIDDYIQYIFTGAHSLYHQAFKIVENGESVFYGGDVASQSRQLVIKYKAKYDADPALAMQLRDEWGQRGRAEGWTFLFYHDIQKPIYEFG